MFSVITNICNKKTKGPTLMELFTATGKLKAFFDMYTWTVSLHQFLVPTQRQSLNVDYSLSFLNNRRSKAALFLLYGIRRLGNTGLIEGNRSWARTMTTVSRHLN